MGDPFVIVGAGAIGGLLGAHLIRAGHPVLLVDVNAEHVAAINRKGVTIEGSGGTFSVTAEAVTPDRLRRPLHRAIMAVKTPHTRSAIDSLAPLLADDGFVVAMQNGLGALDVAERVGGARTIAAAFTFGGFYKEPGKIVFSSPGSFRIGRLGAECDPRLVSLRDAFSAVQPVEITDDILGFVWAKVVLGAVYFSSALVDADVCDQLDRPRVRDLFARIAGEVADIAEAEGARLGVLDGFDAAAFADGGRDPAGIEASWRSQRTYWSGQVQQRTGSWRDLAVHKRKTEAASLLGPVIAKARARQMATPLLGRLIALIAAVEAGRPQGWVLLDELGARPEGATA
jgi:2-dehydropantoate 2-reductase